MKELDKEIKIIKIIFRGIATLIILVGLFFSYIIAEDGDAPGLIIIGTTISLSGAAFMYGFGELIITFKKTNQLLIENLKKNK